MSLADALVHAGITDGWAIDGERIVLWVEAEAGRKKPTQAEIAQMVADWTAANRPVPPSRGPLSAEELYDMLEAKNLLREADRPRPKAR